ncbi:hypothetical protein SCHPADRAFT_944401 [Schizopora paradoxa]|uniref:DUF6699 domain-containing protein n=1 Tax=Schizopora paradoxa TaxID=27342 RepID=A0A0H2R9H2_9AGAM|nr:hypothetical protein SCHPADRAFT_944401 [Schizopora paradoxa]
MSNWPYSFAYPAGAYLGAHPPQPQPARSSSPGVPIIPPGSSPGGSPRLQPAMYQDEMGNNYVWQHGSPWVPAGFVPLPPSPSLLPAQYLPPSRDVSPQRGIIPLPGMPGVPIVPPAPQIYYPQYYPHVNPYAYYAPPKPSVPKFHVHQLLKSDNPYLLLDLSQPRCSPLTPNGRHGVIPVHPAYLTQGATNPDLSKITITCPELAPFDKDWSITVEPSAFSLSDQAGVTVADILATVHQAMQTPVTHAEWAKISEKDVYEVSMAFTRRCRALGPDFERERNQGVKRCDFLRDKIVLTGLSQVKSGDGTTFKLIVKPAKK